MFQIPLFLQWKVSLSAGLTDCRAACLAAWLPAWRLAACSTSTLGFLKFTDAHFINKKRWSTKSFWLSAAQSCGGVLWRGLDACRAHRLPLGSPSSAVPPRSSSSPTKLPSHFRYVNRSVFEKCLVLDVQITMFSAGGLLLWQFFPCFQRRPLILPLFLQCSGRALAFYDSIYDESEGYFLKISFYDSFYNAKHSFYNFLDPPWLCISIGIYNKNVDSGVAQKRPNVVKVQ